MVFVETTAFTRRITALLTDDEYSQLQQELEARPNTGAVIIGGGGIRKLRWGVAGKGKSGGARIIYFWQASQDTMLMLAAYAKSDKQNLTDEEVKALRRAVEEGSRMKEQEFDELLESVKEGFAILRGERKPARVFYRPSPAVRQPPREMYAICIETDDPELLQVLKVYRVSLLASGRVSVIDEAGETALYPADNFILMELPPEAEEALAAATSENREATMDDRL